jgi:excisionase family DNA binding protein
LKGRVQAVEYIHTSEAAAMLGCSDQTVRQLARAQVLDGMRLTPNGYMKIDRASVQAYLQQRRVAGLGHSKSKVAKRRK